MGGGPALMYAADALRVYDPFADGNGGEASAADGT